MSAPADPGRPVPRRGLVLGAGGVLGYAWTVSALRTWAQHSGHDPREVEVVVGTSVGSVVAAALGLGASPGALLRQVQGCPRGDDPALRWDHDADAGGRLPPLPLPGLGSPRLLERVLRHPGTIPPMAAASALLPRGRGTLDPLRRSVRELAGEVIWPGAPRVWLVAMDYDSGERVAFGRPQAPPASLPDAVAASCAIPGWYAPVRIGGRRYVDGGVCSATSADLLVRERLDEVLVFAPLASGVGGARVASWHPLVRGERWLRARTTARLAREVAELRAAGTRVSMLAPDGADLAAMGWNVMDARRHPQVLRAAQRSTTAAWARLLTGGDATDRAAPDPVGPALEADAG